MKVGVKVFEASRELEMIIEKGRPDFIEVMAIEGKDYSKFREYGLPVTVHCEHSRFGVNFSDPLLDDRNRKAVDFAMSVAEMLDSGFIVLHPGYIDTHACNPQTTTSLLRSVYDARMVIENMPYYVFQGRDMMNTGVSPEEMMDMLRATKMGFCLDVGHAAAAAFGFGRDYVDFIRQFMKMKPDYFHFSDSIIKSHTEKHMHLGEGDLDLVKLKNMLPRDAWVVIETPVDVAGRLKDIKFMRS